MNGVDTLNNATLDKASNLGSHKQWVTRLMKDNTGEYNEPIYSLLLMIGDEWAAEKLLEMMPVDSSDYPYRIACFLVRIGEPAVEPLKRYMESCDVANVGMALDVLVELCGEEVLDYVVDLLRSSEVPKVRSVCVQALGMRGSDEVIEVLEFALGDPVYFVRSGAAYWLSLIRCEKVVEPLIKALHDDNGWVCVHAVIGLGCVFNDVAVEALKEASVDHFDAEIRAYTRMMLHKKGKPYTI